LTASGFFILFCRKHAVARFLDEFGRGAVFYRNCYLLRLYGEMKTLEKINLLEIYCTVHRIFTAGFQKISLFSLAESLFPVDPLLWSLYGRVADNSCKLFLEFLFHT